MDIFAEIKKLQLPASDFIVLGSGVMGALGIRRINDIDLLVTPDIFEGLKAKGWEYDVVAIEGRDRERLRQGVIEVFKDFWYNNGTSELRLDAIQPTVIDDIRFLPLEMLREVKQKMGRDKDHNDVVLIDDYLKATS
jgi:hypothetical protein